MSLGIVFKGAEGLVLAADSRVTLMAQVVHSQQPQAQLLVPATYDNATKLLQLNSQKYVAAVTYGTGVIGGRNPRTASSFMPEFEALLIKQKVKEFSVEDFARRLSDFFMDQWRNAGMPVPAQAGQDMTFLVAGYDDATAPYGRIYELNIPSKPVPTELLAGEFGAAWGGQREMTDRLLQGFDPQLPALVQNLLNLPPERRTPDLERELKNRLSIQIPWQLLPLQDCVDLCIFLVRATITIQKWLVGIRGVGGAIDVATITRTKGFDPIQEKKIVGEKYI